MSNVLVTYGGHSRGEVMEFKSGWRKVRENVWPVTASIVLDTRHTRKEFLTW